MGRVYYMTIISSSSILLLQQKHNLKAQEHWRWQKKLMEAAKMDNYSH